MKDLIYLDNAATTFPKPDAVIRAMADCMKNYCGNPGRSSHRLSLLAAEKIYDCRSEIASYFDAPSPESVVFTYNTTYALNMAIKSYLTPGSHVLISDIEHNSVIRPISELVTRGVCTADVFPSAGSTEEIIAGIARRITPNTKMLICNHASNIGARILPLFEIGVLCRKHNMLFVVDGAQSAGTLPISMSKMSIDVLCVPAHKGLYGPQGVGMMICNEGLIGCTFLEGGNGIDSLAREMPKFLPERYEAGTLSAPGIVGLLEGLRWVKRTGTQAIHNAEATLCNQFLDRIASDPQYRIYRMSDHATGTVSFNLSGVPSPRVAEELDKLGICVRAGFHCSPFAHEIMETGTSGAVRVSFGAFNTKKDVLALCDALRVLKRKLL